MSTPNGWITVKSCTDVHSPQTVSPNDLSDPLTSLVATLCSRMCVWSVMKMLSYVMLWPLLTPGAPQTNLMPTASTILHTARSICKHRLITCPASLRLFCPGPPRSAPAMPGSPCLYLCHRGDPEECLWQVYRRCCLLLPRLGLFAWMYEPTSQHWPH